MENPIGPIGVIGWIIGIVSGVIQIKSYIEQKRVEKANKNFLEEIQRDWQGKFTQQQIESLTAQFEELQRQIRLEIPKQARQVFVENQRDALATSISDLYQQYEKYDSELQNSNAVDKLSPELQKIVENDILPDYLKRQRRQEQLWSMILIIFVISVLSVVSTYFSFGEGLLPYITIIVIISAIGISLKWDTPKKIVRNHSLIFIYVALLCLIISLAMATLPFIARYDSELQGYAITLGGYKLSIDYGVAIFSFYAGAIPGSIGICLIVWLFPQLSWKIFRT